MDETPPLSITALSVLQHAAFIVNFLVVPVILFREIGATPETIIAVLQLSCLALGIGAVLQAIPVGPVGSGFLCPPNFPTGYLATSLLAAKAGGLPLLYGMTAFAGAVEMIFSRLLRPLRPLFPPEIAGLVVMLMGFTAGALGFRYVFGIGRPQAASTADLVAAALALLTMIALNVWARGFLKLFCVLIGTMAGTLIAAATGGIAVGDVSAVTNAPALAVPSFGHIRWSFDGSLAASFVIIALAGGLKTMGNVIISQKMNDADWVRPDMRSVSGGVLADGLGMFVGGLLGTAGMNSASQNVGLVSATGVASRVVGYAIGPLFLALAVTPKLTALLMLIPPSVLGAGVLFAACFILVNGLGIIATRLLDARRTVVIGLALLLGVAVDLNPAFFAHAPAPLRAVAGSSLVLGTLCALVLNLAFRIGVRRTRTLVVDPARIDPDELHRFLADAGATWGARRDVIDRASFNLAQSIETIVEGCGPASSLDVEASFDEFRLDIRLSYVGASLELPDRRPTNEEILASDEGQRRLAGFMLRRQADRVATSRRGDRTIVAFHFDH